MSAIRSTLRLAIGLAALALPPFAGAQEDDASRERYFYVSAFLGGADLNVTKLTGIRADSSYGSVGATFGVRLIDGLYIEIGHRRIGDGKDENDYDFGRETYFKLDSAHLGPVWKLPLGDRAEFSASAGIHSWRWRFIERTIPFVGNITETEVRDSGAGAYGRLGVSWQIVPSMTLGGSWTYLDLDRAPANALEARFAYRF